MSLFIKYTFILILGFCNTFFLFSQKEILPNVKRPKLIVGIVIDQMRNDYIYRYWNRFGNGGFKRIVGEGFYFRNAHFNYIPTYTGPGHSSIYTGATPRAHGIIANDWHLKNNSKSTYCVEDTSAKTIGSKNKNGRMSPKNQLSSTFGDEFKMSTNNRGKVFGIALKDRSAILPAGHAANGAFWYDDESGDFISSSWYVDELPVWVKTFNDKKLPKFYLQKGWTTLCPPESYTSSIVDDNDYEAAPNKKEKAVFPYEYSKYIEKNNFAILKATPYGNSLTKDLAIECVKNEQLGKDEEVDVLALSFSSTDIVAHSYGPRAVEIEDIYLRLDKDLEELLNTLDKEIGKNNYTLFLTADHGGADVPKHLIDNKIPAGYLKESKIVKEVRAHFKTNYGDTLILENISNDQIFLNEKKISELKLEKSTIEEKLCSFLVSVNGIAEAYPSSILKNEGFVKNDYRTLLQNGYNHKLSGDVAFIYNAAWMDYSIKGTTHGAGYNYDTHVPVIFYGAGIKKGESLKYISITQIAPTVCELIKINQPNSCTSEPLNDFFR